MAIKLKTLDPAARSFEAGGETYFVETKLSIARFHDYQILEKEAGFSMTFAGMFNEIAAAYKDLQTLKAMDAGVKLHNLMNGMAKMKEKEHVLLKMCALFMNTENEDRGEISEDLISKKIEIWKNEYEVNGFFTQALSTVDGFFKIFAEMHQIISEITEKPAP